MDWPANSPDVSPRELLWRILKNLVKQMKRQTLQEQKSGLLAVWTVISQDTVNRLCKGFQTRLQLCLVNQGETISNLSRQGTERCPLKNPFEANTVHVPWTQDEEK
jgi:hypothetical protein